MVYLLLFWQMRPNIPPPTPSSVLLKMKSKIFRRLSPKSLRADSGSMIINEVILQVLLSLGQDSISRNIGCCIVQSIARMRAKTTS